MKARNEILIIGGGLIGLAIAIDLKLRGSSVTVLTRDRKEAATQAAAGMLAPHAEEITSAPMLELCLRSLRLYSEWISKLEELTGLNTGYWPSGILAPLYELPQTPRENSDSAIWLDEQAIKLYQPGLSQKVVGGWLYPEDGQIDNRLLFKALWQAAENLSVDLQEGITVEAIQHKQSKVTSITTSAGELQADKYIIAGGAWSHQLLPLPVHPVKGQMLCLRMPRENYQTIPLSRVLFGTEIYLVPRKDGRLVVGATVENCGFTHNNTVSGIQKLLNEATALYPQLHNWTIEEMWWGFRPQTPDELPILGKSLWENLYLATGHYRNGILLAPVTTSLLANLILQEKSDPILEHFNHDRFYTKPLMSTITPQSVQPVKTTPLAVKDELIIAGRSFSSRLMTGTGKYSNLELMQKSIAASGSQIVTVAVRRVQSQAPGHEGLAEALDWSQLWMLPNTAGCQTAEEAVRVARLGREMAKLLGQEDNNFVKLEVIPDSKYLLPDPIGTLQAAEQLVKEGFAVLPYINADPLLAKRLEEIGCVTVMPLGSPIGSGQGIKNAANIAIIIEEAKVPVVVDAGIGTPSEAAYAMELGADALLINSAIALAADPVAMGQAMGMATVAGRMAYLAGRMPIKAYASASSPLTGVVS